LNQTSEEGNINKLFVKQRGKRAHFSPPDNHISSEDHSTPPLSSTIYPAQKPPAYAADVSLYLSDAASAARRPFKLPNVCF